MNVVVKHDGTDISNWLISYEREHEICTGIGSVDLTVASSIPRTFHPWDVIEIWENNNKKGKFYVSDLDESARDGTISMQCADESKKLTDYFITDTYTITTLQYSRPWIEKFLTEAKISYTFTVDASDNGVPLSNNTTLGFDAAYTIITTLLQQTGWYIYFDSDGTAIIGDLYKDVNNPDHTLDASDFSNFQRELDDDRLRNRAVVWGNANPTYGQVFVDISVQTPWNYDAQDKRAVVIANGSIYSNDQALALAQKLLQEFTQIKDEKFLLVFNDYNISLGEIIKVNSDIWNGRGLVTRLSASASEKGLVYGVTLDIKCPRMFTFYSELPPTVSGFYVYTGHTVDGIWRKHSEGSVFSQDSSGLTPSTKVNDLFIKNGTFATVLDDGYLYTRTSENGIWNKYTPPVLRDIDGNSYSSNNLRAQACSINYSDNIIAGYNYVASGVAASGVTASGISWVLELTGAQTLVKAEQVVISGAAGNGGDFSIYDLESTGEYNIVTISGIVPISGYITDGISDYVNNGMGYRTIQSNKCINSQWDVDFLRRNMQADNSSLSHGAGYGTWTDTYVDWLTGPDVSTYPYGMGGIISDPNTYTYWYCGSDGLGKIDATAGTTTLYSWTTPTEWTLGDDQDDILFFLRHKTTNVFDIVVVLMTRQQSKDGECTIYHHTYTIGSGLSAGTNVTFTTETGGDWWWTGAGLAGATLLIGYVTNEAGYAFRAQTYNLNSGTLTAHHIADITDYGSHAGNFSECFASTGRGVVSAWFFNVGSDSTYYPNCPLFPANQPTTMNLYGCCIEVTKTGAILTTSPTKLLEVDAPDGPGGDRWFEIGVGRSAPNTILSNATNTVLGRAYVLVPWELEQRLCSGGIGTHQYKGYTLVISLPSLQVHYQHATDWLNYYTDELAPDDTVATYWCKEPGQGLKGYTSSIEGTSSKWGDPGWYISTYPPVYFGLEQKYVYRSAPSWGLRWQSSNPPVWNIYGEQPLDDFTNQLYFANTHDQGSYYGAKAANVTDLDNYNTDVWVIGGSQGIGISQEFIIGTESYYYRIHYLDDNRFNNFPLGSVLKHTSNYNLGTKITASDLALEQTIGNFEIIKTTKYPTKVDIAHGTPTVIYDIPKDDISPVTEDFWASIINTTGSFYQHAVDKPVYESRTLNLLKPNAFPTASGTFTEDDYERYIGVANREGLLASKYDLSTPWVNLVQVASGVIPSGLITHFETTNFVPEGTYIFYTVSGVKSFFQKHPLNNFWSDYSSSLPASPITIIRVDDNI